MLYCHLLIHAEIYIYIYIYILDTYRRNDKDAGRLLYKNNYLSLYCNGSKRVTQGLHVRESWRLNITEIFWPQSYGRQRCVFLVLLLTPVQSGLPRAPSAGCGFPYHISPPTGTRTQLSPSVQFVGLILPSNSHVVIWTLLHASAIFSDIWRSGCVTSAIFGMACVIVIKQK